MIRLALALLALLVMQPGIAAAQENGKTLSKPVSGVVAILRENGSLKCSGFTFGGSIVFTSVGCLFDEGARSPNLNLTIVPTLHNHKRLSGDEPKPFSRHFIRRVHVPRPVAQMIERDGYSFSGLNREGIWDQAIAAVRVHSPKGVTPFNSATKGILVDFMEDVHDNGGMPYTGDFVQYGYHGTDPHAQSESRCEVMRAKGRYGFSARCFLGAGSPGGPFYDKRANVVRGVRIGQFSGENRASYASFREAWVDDLRAMLNGNDSGLNAFATYNVDYRLFSSIDVWNKCDRTVEVAIRYKDANSDSWQSKGFYQVAPGELVILPAPTRNTIFYWTAARKGDDYFAWRGDAWTGTVRGTKVEMRRKEDESGSWRDHRIQLVCD